MPVAPTIPIDSPIPSCQRRAPCDEPPDLRRLRAKRHTHPNLTRPLRGGIGGDGVESDGRQQQRHEGEDHEHRSEHAQADAFVRCGQQIVQRHHLEQREIRIDGADLLAKDGGHDRRIGVRSRHDTCTRQRIGPVRHVDDSIASARVLCAALADVRRNSRDREPLRPGRRSVRQRQADAPADRILAGKHRCCEPFVQNDRCGTVLGFEKRQLRAADDPPAECLEIARSRRHHQHAWAPRLPADHLVVTPEVAPGSAAERGVAGHGRRPGPAPPRDVRRAAGKSARDPRSRDISRPEDPGVPT